MKRLARALILIAFVDSSVSAGELAPPPVMLANVYHRGDAIVMEDYWVSEKLDGVRAWWDGEKLLTRSGQLIAAPAWFTAHWPRETMDGELWAGRGKFEQASATVRTAIPRDDAWRQLRYRVFDLPRHAGTFTQRWQHLQALTAQPIAWIVPVEQFRLRDRAALDARLAETVRAGGEGLMLHRGDSAYRADRSDDLLKYKGYDDAEALVVAHLPGKGKYEGLLGAIEVERPDGSRFRIGSGFSDDQRRHPPPLGSTVTYAYNGLTSKGQPRFARFLRIRRESP